MACLTLGIGGSESAIAAPRRVPVIGEMSTASIAARIDLVGDLLDAEAQVPGGDETTFFGDLFLAAEAGTAALNLGNNSVLTASQQGQPLLPGPVGSPNPANANFGAIVTVADPLPVVPFPVPPLGSIELGELEAATLYVALRDFSVALIAESPLAITSDFVDLSGLDLHVTGFADVSASATFRADTTTDYVRNLLLFQTLADQRDEVLSVEGSCSALEVVFGCPSRQIEVEIAGRFPVDQLLTNGGGRGSFVHDESGLQLEVPLSVSFSDAVVVGVIDYELDFDGQLVANVSRGDLSGDGTINAADIDLLSNEIQGEGGNLLFDVDLDGLVSESDREFWVTQVAQTSLGDVDLDGQVDFRDFAIFANHFDQPGGWSEGDFNGDGIVAFADFSIFSTNFGASRPAGAAAVPEPHGLSLAILGIGALCGWCRRRPVTRDS